LPPQGHPREQRVPFLRSRLSPESLLRDFEGDVYAGLPYVVLIGVKDSPSEQEAVREIHGPAFRAEIESDPEIASMLDRLRALGFEFEWGSYSDSTTSEFALRIRRNPDAEQRFRALLQQSQK